MNQATYEQIPESMELREVEVAVGPPTLIELLLQCFSHLATADVGLKLVYAGQDRVNHLALRAVVEHGLSYRDQLDTRFL
jgi:hypothetical protein